LSGERGGTRRIAAGLVAAGAAGVVAAGHYSAREAEHAAGDALRGNSTPDDGFSIRIFERMKREGVKIEPGYDPLED